MFFLHCLLFRFCFFSLFGWFVPNSFLCCSQFILAFFLYISRLLILICGWEFIFRVSIIEKVVWIHTGLGFIINSSIGTIRVQTANDSIWKDAKTSKITTRIKLEMVDYEMCFGMQNIHNCCDCKNYVFSLILWYIDLIDHSKCRMADYKWFILTRKRKEKNSVSSNCIS